MALCAFGEISRNPECLIVCGKLTIAEPQSVPVQFVEPWIKVGSGLLTSVRGVLLTYSVVSCYAVVNVIGSTKRELIIRLPSAISTLALLAIFPSTALAQLIDQSEMPANTGEDEPIEVQEDAEVGDMPPPILVIGAPGAKREVVVGSRIPRKANFINGSVATSTGTRGLTPGSGMDQASGKFRIRRTETCISDNPAISKRDACLLVEAHDALAAGDEGLAKDLLLSLASDEDGLPETRLAAAEILYSVADGVETGFINTPEDPGREQALLLMLESGAMPLHDDLRARRALVAMALSDGRKDLAQKRLAEIVERDPNDARSMANLAILQEPADPVRARSTMASAIAAAERNGTPVPEGWRSFAAVR